MDRQKKTLQYNMIGRENRRDVRGLAELVVAEVPEGYFSSPGIPPEEVVSK